MVREEKIIFEFRNKLLRLIQKESRLLWHLYACECPLFG